MKYGAIAFASGCLALGAMASELAPVGDRTTPLTLTENGSPVYTVLYHGGAEADRDAALDLAAELGKAAGTAAFPVAPDTAAPDKFISLGATRQAEAAGVGKSLPAGKTAVEIGEKNGNIYLVGSDSASDAAAAFLEGDCGIRFFTDAITR